MKSENPAKEPGNFNRDHRAATRLQTYPRQKPAGWLLALLLLALALTLPISAVSADGPGKLLVDTAYVREKAGQPGWVIVDLRFPDEYAAGHIPGAVLLPGWISKLYADDAKRSATVIPRLEQQLGEMGISNQSNVILYGEADRTSWNGVMFWVLELGGCNSRQAACTVSFYDGGIERWQEEGGTLETVEYHREKTKFTMMAGTGRGVKKDDLLAVVEGKKEAVIIDVRSPGEYSGTDIRALRGGHVPGAVNINYAANFDAASFRMLPLADLRQLYADIPQDRRVITHCQTGQRAAYSYLVLRVLGYEDVAIYHDGWRVYGSDLNMPVAEETWFDFTRVSSTMKAVEALRDELE